MIEAAHAGVIVHMEKRLWCWFAGITAALIAVDQARYVRFWHANMSY